MSYINFKEDLLGMPTVGRAVTATLYVSPNGDNSDGSTWERAYQTIQGALTAASTDVNECTLILIGINTGGIHYDIDTTGDPTFTGNYILKGTHRTWQKVMNDHDTATSILKFTGYVALDNLNFNLGDGSGNGVIITKGAFRVYKCQFVGEDLTGAATALHIDGATTVKHGKMGDIHMFGHSTYMTGLLLENCTRGMFERFRIHNCLKGVHITDGDDATHESNSNMFYKFDILSIFNNIQFVIIYLNDLVTCRKHAAKNYFFSILCNINKSSTTYKLIAEFAYVDISIFIYLC